MACGVVERKARRFLVVALPNQFANRQRVMLVSRHGVQAAIGFGAVDPDSTGAKVWLAIGVALLRLRQAIHGKENTHFVKRANALNRTLRTRTVGGVGAGNFRLPD